MAYITAMHMRRDAVASVEGHIFSNLQEAFDEAVNSTVVLLCDLVVSDCFVIHNANMTFDLAGHSLMVKDVRAYKGSARKTAAFTITAPSIVIRNGVIACSSGVPEAILVQTPPVYMDEYTASVLLERVTLRTCCSECGIYVRGGGVYLKESSIASTGPGIYMRNIASWIGAVYSFIRAGRCGIVMKGGRLLLKDSLVSSGASCAIHISGGSMAAHNTTIRAHNGCALVSAYSLRAPEPPIVEISENSEICSYSTYAMDIKAGDVQVSGARIRATQSTAIRMDVEPGMVPDNHSAQLVLSGRSHVISWKGDGILYHRGKLVVGDTVFECDRGKDVVGRATEAALDNVGVDAYATGEGVWDKAENDAYTEELSPIERIDISRVQTSLQPHRPVKFSGALDSLRESSSQMEIVFEQWTNGADIITSYDPLPPQENSTYRYIIALKAKKGYAFSRRFALYYRGQRIRYNAMISNDLKRAMISWDLKATATNLRWLRIPVPR